MHNGNGVHSSGSAYALLITKYLLRRDTFFVHRVNPHVLLHVWQIKFYANIPPVFYFVVVVPCWCSDRGELVVASHKLEIVAFK